MAGLSDAVMGIAVIAALLLIAGGIRLAWKRQDRKRGALMVVAALVILMNVMIWTV